MTITRHSEEAPMTLGQLAKPVPDLSSALHVFVDSYLTFFHRVGNIMEKPVAVKIQFKRDGRLVFVILFLSYVPFYKLSS